MVLLIKAKASDLVGSSGTVNASSTARQSAAVASIEGEFAAHGVRAHRLAFLPLAPREAHLERAGHTASLSLDTPGYNGGTSGLDALWTGLPLLTLPLRQWVERMGLSLVSHAGLATAAVHSVRAIDDVAVALLAGEGRAAAGAGLARRGTASSSTPRAGRRRPVSIEVGG